MKRIRAGIPSRITLTAALTAVLAASSAVAASPTTLLFAGNSDGAYPVAAVRDGAFARLTFPDTKDKRAPLRYRFGSGAKEETALLRGRKLLGYRDGTQVGAFQVRGADITPMTADPVLDMGAAGSKPANLLSTTPLLSAGRAPASTPDDIRAARSLVEALLAQERVPRKAQAAILGSIKVEPVRVTKDGAPVLIVNGDGPLKAGKAKDDEEESVFSFLLIAEKADGKWHNRFQRKYAGAAVCGVTNWGYLDHADLDGDGTDELVLDAWGFESSYTAAVLRRAASGHWQSTAAGELPRADEC